VLRPKPPNELGLEAGADEVEEDELLEPEPELWEALDPLVELELLELPDGRPKPPELCGLLGVVANERWLWVGLSRARALAAVWVAFGDGSEVIFGVVELLTGTAALRCCMSRE
jgi:hypothetical protein